MQFLFSLGIHDEYLLDVAYFVSPTFCRGFDDTLSYRRTFFVLLVVLFRFISLTFTYSKSFH